MVDQTNSITDILFDAVGLVVFLYRRNSATPDGLAPGLSHPWRSASLYRVIYVRGYAIDPCNLHWLTYLCLRLEYLGVCFSKEVRLDLHKHCDHALCWRLNSEIP